jgi:hypothetical protein
MTLGAADLGRSALRERRPRARSRSLFSGSEAPRDPPVRARSRSSFQIASAGYRGGERWEAEHISCAWPRAACAAQTPASQGAGASSERCGEAVAAASRSRYLPNRIANGCAILPSRDGACSALATIHCVNGATDTKIWAFRGPEPLRHGTRHRAPSLAGPMAHCDRRTLSEPLSDGDRAPLAALALERRGARQSG